METADQEVLALSREDGVVTPVRQSQQDLTVRLEGNVTADHVVEEDAEGPDGQAVRRVPPVLDPLRGSVDSGPFKYRGQSC